MRGCLPVPVRTFVFSHRLGLLASVFQGSTRSDEIAFRSLRGRSIGLWALLFYWKGLVLLRLILYEAIVSQLTSSGDSSSFSMHHQAPFVHTEVAVCSED